MNKPCKIPCRMQQLPELKYCQGLNFPFFAVVTADILPDTDLSAAGYTERLDDDDKDDYGDND